MLLFLTAIRKRIAARQLKEALYKELVLQMEYRLIPMSAHLLKDIPIETFTAHNGDTISLRVWPQLQHLQFTDGARPEKVFYSKIGVLKYIISGVEGRWLVPLRPKDLTVESLQNTIEAVNRRVWIITAAKNYVARERLTGKAKDMPSDVRQFMRDYVNRHGNNLSNR